MTTTKQLSILLGMDSFVYTVISQGQAVLYKNYTIHSYDSKYPELYLEDLKRIILTDADLKPSFQKIFLGLIHPLAVIVPAGLYDEKERRVFLHHLTDKADDLAVLTADIEAIQAKVVFSLDHQVVEVLDHLLPTAHITHLWATIIDYLLEYHCGYQDGPHLFVNFHLNSLEIFAFDQKWLLYSNSFNFGEAEDILYAVLLVIQELKFDAQKVPVFLAGQIIEDSAIYRLLYRFLPKLRFFEEVPLYEFGSKVQQMPPHYFIDIMSLSGRRLKK